MNPRQPISSPSPFSSAPSAAPAIPIAGQPAYSANWWARGASPAATTTASPTARNAIGLNATANQRRPIRRRVMRRARSPMPRRPLSPAVTANAAIAGANGATKRVGQMWPRCTVCPAASSAKLHPHAIAQVSA